MAERKRQRRQENHRQAGRVSIRTQTVKSRMILSEHQEEVELEAELFVTDPAYVRISHGVTKNIGEYESMRIDVSVSIPCYRELVDETAQQCGETVALYLERELDEYGLNLHG